MESEKPIQFLPFPDEEIENVKNLAVNRLEIQNSLEKLGSRHRNLMAERRTMLNLRAEYGLVVATSITLDYELREIDKEISVLESTIKGCRRKIEEVDETVFVGFENLPSEIPCSTVDEARAICSLSIISGFNKLIAVSQYCHDRALIIAEVQSFGMKHATREIISPLMAITTNKKIKLLREFKERRKEDLRKGRILGWASSPPVYNHSPPRVQKFDHYLSSKD